MIQILKIQGGNRLNGTINCPSAKNAILPIIAGAVMTDGDVRIRGCSRLTDTEAMLKILRALGARGSDVFGIFFNESLVIALINFTLAKGKRFNRSSFEWNIWYSISKSYTI